MSTFRLPNPARVCAALAGAAVVAVGGAATAGAHVTVTPDHAAAGSHVVLTFSVPHGCELSSTTEVAIDIPEQVLSITPTAHPSWTVKQLAADGSPAEGAPPVRVVYTARQPLPSDLRDAFELSVRMPDEAGDTLAFPVVQTCEEGRAEWVELAEEGEDPHDLEYPAPLVEVIEPTADGHGSAAPANHDEAAPAANVAAESDDGAATTLGVAGIAVGAVGVVLSAVALALLRTRRRASRP